MEIKVLGTGCAKCKALEKVTRDAVAELEIEATIEKEEDIQKIMAYGILSTPGLVINEKIVLQGQLPKLDKIKEIILENK